MIYLLWLPIQGWFISFLAATSERALRLIERPPIITSLLARENRILVYSFVTGLEEPMAAWNGWKLHLYVVVSLALVLAVPLRDRRARVMLIALAIGIISLVSVAITVVQLETLVETHADTHLGITLHTLREIHALDLLNRGLIMIGMILFPTLLFLMAFMISWTGHRGESRGRSERDRASRPWLTRLITAGVTAVLLASLSLWTVLATRPPPADPRVYFDGWEKVLRLNPDYIPALVNVGVRREEEGHPAEAVDYFRRALELDPDHVTAAYDLGNALAALGRYEEASRAYMQVVERQPDDARARKNLGIVLLQLGDSCAALPHLERSAELDVVMLTDPRLRDQIRTLRSICPPESGDSGGDARVPAGVE